MLIIFDLDDTLIETSKCLTPHYLKAAFEAMGSMGSFEELLEINASSLTQRMAISKFWQKHSRKEEILEYGLGAMRSLSPKNFDIKCVPNALEILDDLGKSNHLALVTCGKEDIQLQKMEKAGIQRKRFSKLIVIDGGTKKFGYQKVIEDLQQDPADVIVCGDRIPLDLSPGKELGFYTVHFENGRGKNHKQPREDVDLSIKDLNELTRICQKK